MTKKTTAVAKAPDIIRWIASGVRAVHGKLVDHFIKRLSPDCPASELAHTFQTIRALQDEWKKVGDWLNEAEKKLSEETIPAAFEREKINSFTLQDGSRVTLSTRFYASILPGLKEDAFKWLRKNKLGDLITETVNASTLSAAGKKMLEEGKELPEKFFRTHYQPGTSLTKGKKGGE